MKRLRPEFVGHPRYVALMRKEYETGTTLSHPNLVQYVSWGEDIEGPYLLTDYIDGVTLADQIERWKTAPPTAPQVCSIFTQLLQCLGYLHSHQVIHLDLKPDNIMLTRVGNVVKLIDQALHPHLTQWVAVHWPRSICGRQRAPSHHHPRGHQGASYRLFCLVWPP